MGRHSDEKLPKKEVKQIYLKLLTLSILKTLQRFSVDNHCLGLGLGWLNYVA